MKSEFIEYTGGLALDNIREAKNYNNLFEKLLVKFLANKSEILDFGAGKGEFAYRLKNCGIKTFCVEIDPNYYADLESNGLEVKNDVSKFPQKFDKIYSFHVLEHIEDDVSALKSIYDKMNTGAEFFICVPSFMCLYSHFDKKIGHFRRYTKQEMVSKLKQVGFEVSSAKYMDSIGFMAILFFKLVSKQDSDPSLKSIIFYDKYIFPISRFCDLFFSRLFGRHLVVYARR